MNGVTQWEAKEIIREKNARIEALTAENERMREALEEWVFRYAWKAEGMNTEQARIHAKAFMARAALEGEP
jgi:vacuolar-type H+-ATPase subunit E/Vma4